MPLRATFSKMIVIAFMILIGFSLARSIYYKSIMGVTLSLVSFAAGIYFLLMVARLKQEQDAEETY